VHTIVEVEGAAVEMTIETPHDVRVAKPRPGEIVDIGWDGASSVLFAND